jgi:hypothetical protein
MRVHEVESNDICHRKKILFICGTMNTTTMLHQISKQLPGYDCFFTHLYADGIIGFLAEKDLLNFVPLGGKTKENTIKYFRENNLMIDFHGKANNYDLIVSFTDLLIPENIKKTKILHVQEGMTDPEDLRYYLVKYLRLPIYLASTSVVGLSDNYEIFCVASEGYKDLFIKKGVNPNKIRVTGIPNFDNFKKYENNEFHYRNFVLVATSDSRETFKYENRIKFIKRTIEIANGRKLIFKLHPNEKVDRASKEIKKLIPNAIIYHDGDIREMIANCDVLITKYSSVVYCGIALGKEVYTEADIDELKRLSPIQNNSTSARNIAEECKKIIETEFDSDRQNLLKFEPIKLFKYAMSNFAENKSKKAI